MTTNKTTSSADSATSTPTRAKTVTLTQRATRLEEHVKELEWHSVGADTRITDLERRLDYTQAEARQAKRESIIAAYLAICSSASSLILYVAWIIR